RPPSRHQHQRDPPPLLGRSARGRGGGSSSPGGNLFVRHERRNSTPADTQLHTSRSSARIVRRPTGVSTRLLPVEPDEPRRTHRNSHRSEEHTSELQSRENLVCRLLLEKKKIE